MRQKTHRVLWILAVELPALSPGCGQDRFEMELAKEKLAVSLAREVGRGAYALITAEELRELLGQKPDLILVDALPYEESYRADHLPGARSFPFPIPEMAEWDEKQVGGKTKEDYSAFLGEDESKPVVVYCGCVNCGRSHNAALWAVKLGYTDVRRFAGGINAWKGAGLPTESSP